MRPRAAAIVVSLLLSAGFSTPRAGEEDLTPLRPHRGGKLVPVDLAPESVVDGATNYQNDHGESGLYFVFGTRPPRRPVWGESLRLASDPGRPLEIRSIELNSR